MRHGARQADRRRSARPLGQASARRRRPEPLSPQGDCSRIKAINRPSAGAEVEEPLDPRGKRFQQHLLGKVAYAVSRGRGTRPHAPRWDHFLQGVRPLVEPLALGVPPWLVPGPVDSSMSHYSVVAAANCKMIEIVAYDPGWPTGSSGSALPWPTRSESSHRAALATSAAPPSMAWTRSRSSTSWSAFERLDASRPAFEPVAQLGYLSAPYLADEMRLVLQAPSEPPDPPSPSRAGQRSALPRRARVSRDRLRTSPDLAGRDAKLRSAASPLGSSTIARATPRQRAPSSPRPFRIPLLEELGHQGRIDRHR